MVGFFAICESGYHNRSVAHSPDCEIATRHAVMRPPEYRTKELWCVQWTKIICSRRTWSTYAAKIRTIRKAYEKPRDRLVDKHRINRQSSIPIYIGSQ